MSTDESDPTIELLESRILLLENTLLLKDSSNNINGITTSFTNPSNSLVSKLNNLTKQLDILNNNIITEFVLKYNNVKDILDEKSIINFNNINILKESLVLSSYDSVISTSELFIIYNALLPYIDKNIDDIPNINYLNELEEKTDRLYNISQENHNKLNNLIDNYVESIESTSNELLKYELQLDQLDEKLSKK